MYERIWNFRGMENLLMDYYDYPDEVHALHRAVADTEKKLILRAIREVKPDGYMISDDLGTQNALMMSPATFRELSSPTTPRSGDFAASTTWTPGSTPAETSRRSSGTSLSAV